jgi:hypothetical protein
MEQKYSLPDMTFKFKIQVKGSESGVNWVGDFKYRRPALGARTRIDVMRARLSGDLESLDPQVILFNEAIAHLRFTLEEYPDWWKETGFGIDLYDGNVVSEVFNRCMDFEKDWKTRIHGGDAKSVGVNDGDFDADNAVKEFKQGTVERSL